MFSYIAQMLFTSVVWVPYLSIRRPFSFHFFSIRIGFDAYNILPLVVAMEREREESLLCYYVCFYFYFFISS
jgi:hypothetical protein